MNNNFLSLQQSEKKTVTFTVAPAPSSRAQEVGNEAKMSRTTSGTNCFRTAATAEQLPRLETVSYAKLEINTKKTSMQVKDS